MTEEGMRGVRMNLLDCVLHADTIHRGAGQILPTARRLFYACELTAEPRLQEPIFVAEITAPQDAMGGVYNCLNQRRGIINEEEQISGTPMSVVITNYNFFIYPFNNFTFSQRLKLTSLSLNPSVSPLISEVSLKVRLSLNASSIIGLPSPHLPSKLARLSISSTPSERERVSRKVFPILTTISISYDRPNNVIYSIIKLFSFICRERYLFYMISILSQHR